MTHAALVLSTIRSLGGSVLASELCDALGLEPEQIYAALVNLEGRELLRIRVSGRHELRHWELTDHAELMTEIAEVAE